MDRVSLPEALSLVEMLSTVSRSGVGARSTGVIFMAKAYGKLDWMMSCARLCRKIVIAGRFFLSLANERPKDDSAHICTPTVTRPGLRIVLSIGH